MSGFSLLWFVFQFSVIYSGYEFNFSTYHQSYYMWLMAQVLALYWRYCRRLTNLLAFLLVGQGFFVFLHSVHFIAYTDGIVWLYGVASSLNGVSDYFVWIGWAFTGLNIMAFLRRWSYAGRVRGRKGGNNDHYLDGWSYRLVLGNIKAKAFSSRGRY